ncbi:MAG: UDP-N-acetylmuramate dehydrogenase [Desulfobacteraceae bacterium]|nr:UDP-N-acetylmuramate dehydrogenase [Desulfobacteraceae bacterium]
MPFRDLARIKDVDVGRDVPLAPLTTFRIGGRARVFIRPMTITALENILDYLHGKAIAYKVLGRGSNLLVDDRGVEAVLSLAGINDISGPAISNDAGGWLAATAGAGCGMGAFIAWASKRGLCGPECFCGIPGSVGGVVAMNAGASSGAIGDILHSVCFTGPGGSRWVLRDELEFNYRRLDMPDGVVVSAARFRLGRDEPVRIFSRIRTMMQKRTASQPLGKPSAGCIFKNPAGDSAGRLIDICGLKGYTAGGAQVSSRHANFILNIGGASSSAVLDLMEFVKERVMSVTGVRLASEIVVWGMKQ